MLAMPTARSERRRPVATVPAPNATPPVIETINLRKVYVTGDTELEALKSISLTIPTGAFVAITGPSGSGKSTFMNVLGCLDRPTSGSYRLAGQDVSGLNETELAHVRGRRLGFVFQGFNLLQQVTTLENVELPMVYAGVPTRERRERAISALESVGLGDRLQHRPAQLSGGQQQRVAIARSLVNHPDLILADEPTGNLDTKTTSEVLDIFQKLNDDGISIVVVTHEPEVARRCKGTIMFRDGALVDDQEQIHAWREGR
jgi:putative ABC transport system ATP-binding protein